jgi:hypothetical protein
MKDRTIYTTVDDAIREIGLYTTARLRNSVAILTAALLISSAEAAQLGNYNLLGSGTISCGTWTALRRQGQASLPEQWILGFLSGVGYEGGGRDNPLSGVDADAVWAWMDNYCHANPLDHIAEAGAAFDAIHPVVTQFEF